MSRNNQILLDQPGGDRPLAGTNQKAHVIPYYFNVGTLEYDVATSGGTGVGTEVEVTNFPANPATSTLQTTGNTHLSNISSSLTTKYVVRLETSGTTTYIGKAVPGTATSSALWQIAKMDTSTGTVVTWAGSAAFNQIWDNRAGLTYT